jgi:hypothetical protein
MLDQRITHEIDFWTEFDNTFHWNLTPETSDLFVKIFNDKFTNHTNFDVVYNSWSDHRSIGDYPQGFMEQFTSVKAEISTLSDMQLGIIDKYFLNDLNGLQKSFEDFGSGVLYDPNRPNDPIHKMDDFTGPPIGYHRWHTFIRIFTLLTEVPSKKTIWLNIDRFVGLAWALQSTKSSSDSNIPQEKMNELRTKWLELDFDKLDKEFDSYPYPLS